MTDLGKEHGDFMTTRRVRSRGKVKGCSAFDGVGALVALGGGMRRSGDDVWV